MQYLPQRGRSLRHRIKWHPAAVVNILNNFINVCLGRIPSKRQHGNAHITNPVSELINHTILFDFNINGIKLPGGAIPAVVYLQTPRSIRKMRKTKRPMNFASSVNKIRKLPATACFFTAAGQGLIGRL